MSFQFPAARVTGLAALAYNADKAVIISPLTEGSIMHNRQLQCNAVPHKKCGAGVSPAGFGGVPPPTDQQFSLWLWPIPAG
jgi:hypothetical protein